MGVNLESGNLRRRFQRQPTGGWSRLPDSSGDDRPVRVYTLGRFGVQVHGEAVANKQTRRHRPLELLQALIALGGRDVGEDIICQALWPDADGDLARNNFDVTLHRLRRTLAVDNLLLMCNHRLTLNSQLAWVDAWTFERLVNLAERLLPRLGQRVEATPQLIRVSERLLALYQGNFLDREASGAWSLTLRERLRSKLLRHILDVGQAWERIDEPGQAIRFYRKGLEIDPLMESLYQRLMSCLQALGQRGEALAVFRRCQDVLDRQFRIQPSPPTLALYAALLR
jgi:two-component SAPR family response regulator